MKHFALIMWAVLIGLFVFALPRWIMWAALIGLFVYSAFALPRAARRLKEAGVPLAVEIARLKGWVSAYRLMAQSQMKKAQAEIVLAAACKQGLLKRQSDGRYYLP